ncbi:MAG: L-arabinose isomerase [Ruminococcaceae bacterium]|nr:L-arabinose isomerase [Oscillospiraceae bacterium]
MNKIYFIIGSQDLYGDETLMQAQKDGNEMAEFLDLKIGARVEALPIVRNGEEALWCIEKANTDKECIGVICWMHTFSPAKMWIKALKILNKPMLHLHTQYNEKLPYDSIDMDFMNLNQSAHGDREFGFICTRLGIKREVVVGYYKNEEVIKELSRFTDVARAIAFSKKLKVAMFGNNMRDVAVTDGDRVESEIKYGWNVNYYGIGDLVKLIEGVSDSEVEAKMAEYEAKYTFATKNIDAVKEQAKYEVALEKFMAEKSIGAFTDTFEDLNGLSQLPGLSVQNIMARGIGFGPEGDYKTSALSAVLFEMAKGRNGATGFSEDYTYDLTFGQEVELAAHMLEVSPVFADNKPEIQVHPLGIGGKSDPARLVFDGIEGEGIAVCMIDMGNRFRLICAEISLIKAIKEMPNLPVARLMWKLKPDFKTGAKAWIYAGGAHHAVVSTALSVDDIRIFAKFTDTELIVIDNDTNIRELEQQLNILDKLS